MSSPGSEPKIHVVEESSIELGRDRKRSSLSILRDAALSASHIVEDSTELIGATVREELERFRLETGRQALGLLAVVAGGGLLTAGLAMYLEDLLGSWPLTLVLGGALYLGIGLSIHHRLGRAEDDDRRPDTGGGST